MGKCSVEFEVVSKFTISLEVCNDDFVEDVAEDIQTIVSDYDAQIEDMINGDRKPKLITEHGHVIHLVTSREVKLTDAGEQAVLSEIEK